MTASWRLMELPMAGFPGTGGGKAVDFAPANSCNVLVYGGLERGRRRSGTGNVGELRKARKMFDEMLQRDAKVRWLAIYGAASLKRHSGLYLCETDMISDNKARPKRIVRPPKP